MLNKSKGFNRREENEKYVNDMSANLDEYVNLIIIELLLLKATIIDLNILKNLSLKSILLNHHLNNIFTEMINQ